LALAVAVSRFLLLRAMWCAAPPRARVTGELLACKKWSLLERKAIFVVCCLA
jgi:hypothetical protein